MQVKISQRGKKNRIKENKKSARIKQVKEER